MNSFVRVAAVSVPFGTGFAHTAFAQGPGTLDDSDGITVTGGREKNSFEAIGTSGATPAGGSLADRG